MSKKSVFEKVSLSWFGDSEHISDDPDIEVDGQDDFDIVEVDDLNQPDEPEDDGRVVLSPEEFQNLKSQTDTAGAFKQGLAELGEVLNKSNRSSYEEVPQQQPGESAEDFKKRVNERLFGDDPYTVLKEVISRELGPLAQTIGGITSQQAKDLMMVKDDTKKYFSKYKGDIEEYHKSLPRDQQSNPRSWQYAYDEVLKSKRDDIIETEINERFDDMFKSKMQELGIEAPPASKKQGVYLESGGMTGHNVGPKKKRQVKITSEDRRKADQMGIGVEDYLLGQGRL